MDPFDDFDTIKNSKIEISLEINGRKKNTYVAGWNLSESELKDHIKIIKRKNGCNGSLKEKTLDNGNKINIIQLQGDHIEYIKEYLLSCNVDEDNIRIRG